MSREERHTPGPWAVRPHWSDEERFEVYPDRDVDFGEPSEIAEVCGHYGDDDELAAEAEANAYLIAAAPELKSEGKFLLARLEEFERDLLDDDIGREFAGHVAPAIARLRAAVLKAEGL